MISLHIIDKLKTSSNKIKGYLNLHFLTIVAKKTKIFFIILETFNNREETLKKFTDYQKDFILIRIESIKDELDKLGESLYSNLDAIQTQIRFELDGLDREYNELLIKNEKLILQTTDSLENLYAGEENLKEMENFNQSFINKLKKIKFNINDEWIPDSSIIGNLEIVERDIIERLKIISPRKLDLDPLSVQLVSGMSVLNDNKLLLVDTDANEILVLDKNFQLEERIKQIGDETFNYPLNICTDNDENVYLCDYNNNRVMFIDKNLKVVRKTLTTNIDYISSPIDICFYDDCLFILDNLKSNIKQFLRDGVFVREINLVDNNAKPLSSPIRLTLNGELIAVLDNWKNVHLFDINGNYKDSIVAADEVEVNTVYFYEKNLFCIDKQGKFSCYNMNDDDKIEVVFERILPFSNCNSDYMVFFDNKLIIAYCYSNFLAIFDLD
jgi:hypothetical protein